MIYVLIIAIVTQLIFLLMSRAETVPERFKESKITEPFYRLGSWIFKRTFGENENFYYRKIYEKNSLIYAAKECREITANYFIEKLGLCTLVLFVGTIFVLLMFYKTRSESTISDGNLIKRGDYTASAKMVYLDAEVDDEKLEDIRIVIPAKKYTEDEFYSQISEYTGLLEKLFLDENKSPDFVNRNVNFVSDVSGYPFIVEWKWDRKNLINSDGELQQGISEEGEIVDITAVISYENYESEHEFFIHVYPKELSKSEYLLNSINRLLASNQESTKTEEYMELPTKVDGIEITWQEEKTGKLLIFVLMIFVSVLAVFFGKDMDLDKKIEERNQQMMEDYSEIISKLTLLVGAGMSVALAWKKIARDYSSERNDTVHYAYEEMLYTMYEMESGVEESVCYQHFADRVKVQKYVKMVSLLEQNIKMGSKGLIEDLRAESKDAFSERKNMAERKGEESATKLLLPMFMMLLVVMVVIMVPAFMSM